MVSEDMTIFMESVVAALNTHLELINRHDSLLDDSKFLFKKQEKEINKLTMITNRQNLEIIKLKNKLKTFG